MGTAPESRARGRDALAAALRRTGDVMERKQQVFGVTVRWAVGLGILGVGASALVVAGAGAPRAPALMGGCPSAGCGQNSPDVDKSPIHGLNLDGIARAGVRLVPGSLRGGHCRGRRAMSLGVVEGGFVGVAAGTPVAVCAGADLVGATFELELAGERVLIEIAARTSVATWERDATSLPAYLLRRAGADRAPLCTTTDPRAILVSGELYDARDATVAPVPVTERQRWFNVACLDSGLAKMRRLGLDPGVTDRASPRWSSADERQATLKMITARYCGARSYTADGTTIQWRRGGPPAAGPGPVEAVWGADGAICLSHPRAQPGADSTLADAIRATCGIPVCAASPAVGGRQWLTRTLDGGLAPR